MTYPISFSTAKGASFHRNFGRGSFSVYATNNLPKNGFISGRVFEEDTPVARHVLCYDRKTKLLAGSAWSNFNGDYTITNLNPNSTYYLVAINFTDGVKQYNAVIEDLITPHTLSA